MRSLVRNCRLWRSRLALETGETVIAEAGGMSSMEDGIRFEARLGDGSDSEGGLFSKLADAGKRMFAGESMLLTHFTNHANERRTVAFASPFAGQILAIDLSRHSEGLLCQRELFLCASRGTSVVIAFQKKLGA